MRLQFLGDSRDAFKWDLLHWICTESNPPYNRLTIIPMLNPDDPDSTHGRTSPESFGCRPAIYSFLNSLREEPRKIDRLKNLGNLEGLDGFDINLYHPNRNIGSDWNRAHYWDGLTKSLIENSLVFVDPDTGFETRTQAGEKHLRFGETLDLLNRLDDQSCLVVFQYRPQGQSWQDVLNRISAGNGLRFFKAMVCGNTALVMLAKYETVKGRVDQSLTYYSNSHSDVDKITIEMTEYRLSI
jgi:hypothetical protein